MAEPVATLEGFSSTTLVAVHGRHFVRTFEARPDEEFLLERVGHGTVYNVRLRVRNVRIDIGHTWLRHNIDEQGEHLHWMTVSTYHDTLDEALLRLRQQFDCDVRSALREAENNQESAA